MAEKSTINRFREWRWLFSKGSDGICEDLRRLPQRVAGDAQHPGWNLDPDYQRGHVWSQRQQELFLGHFVEGGIMLPIFVQRYEGPQNCTEGDWLDQPCEVVDGKQRLQALLDWIAGKVVAEVSTGERLAWSDLTDTDRRIMANGDLRITYIDLPRADRLRFYLKLNRGGSVHTDDEIDRVRALLATEEDA